MDGLYGTQMVHRWYELIVPYTNSNKKKYKNFCTIHRWYADGMDGLYGAQMVHRWYADGTNKSYGTRMVHRWYK